MEPSDSDNHIVSPESTPNEEIGRGAHAAPRVSEILPGFLEYLRIEEGRVTGTVERYQGHMTRFVSDVGDCRVSVIDSEKVMLWKKRLIDAGLAPVTIGGMLSCLRKFLWYAREVRALETYDPEKIRRPKIPKRQVEYLSKDEMRRFLDAIPTKNLVGLRDRALTEVLCSTGMRISEALFLDRRSVDWETREARVIGKGNRQRKVYFSEEALEWLRRYLDLRRDDEPALFVTQGHEARRLDGHSTWRRFRRYAARAGLGRRVYPHLLRHTMATTLLANGCPIGHIRAMLGHAHLATTCRYYLGVMSDAEVKAAHAKYLSYDISEDKTNEKLPRQENVTADSLTEETGRIE